MFPLLIKSRKLSFCSEFWLLVSVQSSGSGSWLWLLSSAVFDRSGRLMEWLIEVVVAYTLQTRSQSPHGLDVTDPVSSYKHHDTSCRCPYKGKGKRKLEVKAKGDWPRGKVHVKVKVT